MGDLFNTAELLRQQRLLASLSGDTANTITPTVAPIAPTQEVSPTMSQYREAVAKQPMFDEYKPSLGRRIISRLISMGKDGDAAGEEARNLPFSRAYKGWKQRVDTLGGLAEMERATGKSGAEIEHLGAQSEAERELAAYRRYQGSNTAFEREKELTGMRNVPTPHYYSAPQGEGYNEVEVMPGGEPRVLGPTVRTGTSFEQQKQLQDESLVVRERMNNANNAARATAAKLKNAAIMKGINATQQKAAYELAVKQVQRANPGYFDKEKGLFTTDEKGNMSLRAGFDMSLYNKYLADIEFNYQAALNQVAPELEDKDDSEDDPWKPVKDGDED